MKRFAILAMLLTIVGVCVGCGIDGQTAMRTGNASFHQSPHFGAFPPHPSSIVVTSYVESGRPAQGSSHAYTLTGTPMTKLYQSLQQAAERVLPKHWSASCPTYSSNTLVWNFHIVVHYAHHRDRSFTQTDTGCTLLKDDQTGAMEMGALPELQPFGDSAQKWLNQH